MIHKQFHGLGVTSGIAVGRIYVVDRRSVRVPRYHLPDDEARFLEIERFERAVSQAAQQISDLATKAQDSGLKQVSKLLEAHASILYDDALFEATRQRIRKDGFNAEWSLRTTLKDIRKLFDKLERGYFRERRGDVDTVGERLMRNLTGDGPDTLGDLPNNSVIVAYDLAPGDTVSLARNKVSAFVTELGGRTSHTAIMAKALDIPCVLGVKGIMDHASVGASIVVDAHAGEVFLSPDESTKNKYLGIKQQREDQRKALLAERDVEAKTVDGVRVNLWGNVEVSTELSQVVACGGVGVGLYRTEFLSFEYPDLDETISHAEIYRQMLEQLGGRTLTVRTFDIGADKTAKDGPSSLGVMPARRLADNPALGLRGVRLSLHREREGFRRQIRGILEASAQGSVRLLIPFVTTLDELREVKEEIAFAKQQLTDEGIPFDTQMPVGVMVETPAVALLVEHFARECDFLAVGTNDLVQYLLATDRSNDAVAYQYRPCHPGVLLLLKQVVRAGQRYQIPVSICGEFAGDVQHAPLLVGLGLVNLSMNPSAIPIVKRIIRNISFQECEALADEVLELGTEREVAELMQKKWYEWSLDKLLP